MLIHLSGILNDEFVLGMLYINNWSRDIWRSWYWTILWLFYVVL